MDKRLRAKLDRIATQRRGARIPAFMGDLTTGDVTVEGKTSFANVTVAFNGQVLTVKNNTVPSQLRLPILLGYPVGSSRLQIIGELEGIYPNLDLPILPDHPHTWGVSNNPAWIRKEQILELLPHAIGGMVLRVNSGVYEINGDTRFFVQDDLDVTAYIPASGANWCAVCVDVDGVITYVDGAAYDTREELTVENKPTITRTKRVLAYVKMYAGQTELIQTTQDSDILDPRLISGSVNGVVIDTDTAMAADSDEVVPSQKAVKAYAAPVSHVHDASVITYTPAVSADWNGSADPGDVDNALDQLAERVTDLEAGGGSVTAWKDAVVVATTANGTLASDFENGDTVDGIVLATGNRILIKDQTDATENGIYTVNASGAPTRATDANTGALLLSACVVVKQGTVNADRAFLCTNDSITLGATNITFLDYAGVLIHNAQAASLADADEMGFWQSTSGFLRKITWANVKAALDSLYAAITHTHAGALDNGLINGGFDLFRRINPTTATAMTDDDYNAPDLWYSLVQGAGATIERAAGIGTSQYSAKIIAGGTTNRYGIAQIKDANYSIAKRGKTVTAQIRIKPTNNAGSGSRDYRIALLEWTGTADSVTRDVVNDWTSSNYTTGNFFASTTLTLIGTATKTIAHGAEDVASISGAVSASCNNLIVFVWVEDVPTHASDYAQFGEAGLYESSSIQGWSPQPELDLLRAEYYIQDYLLGGSIWSAAYRYGTKYILFVLPFRGRMRAAPTHTHNISAWTAGAPTGTQMAAYDYVGDAFITLTGSLTFAIDFMTEISGRIDVSASTSLSGSAGSPCDLRFGSDVKVILSAEL